MCKQSVDAGYGRAAELLRTELNYWKRLLDELPDARLDKVCATRSNLNRNGYDDERILDETVRRISDEIGVLCRPADPAENQDMV